MKFTIAQRLIAGLLTMNWVEGKRTTHYRVFTKDGRPTLYVGPAGALRCSHAHKVTQTRVVADKFRDTVLQYGDSHPRAHHHYQ